MANEKYAPLLEYLSENEEKLKIFLSADDKAKAYRYRIKGKKSSRTVCFPAKTFIFAGNKLYLLL